MRLLAMTKIHYAFGRLMFHNNTQELEIDLHNQNKIYPRLGAQLLVFILGASALEQLCPVDMHEREKDTNESQ
jgi:hypothetical protein